MSKSKAVYMTVPQAAKRLKRSENTIRAWIKEGKLTADRGGDSTLYYAIPIEAVEALAEELKIGLVMKD